MLKLETWLDFVKFNKELLEDDYNPGQALVVKAKLKSADGTTVIYSSLDPYLMYLQH